MIAAVPSQTDKLGQQVHVGDTVLASYMAGRSHRFERARVTGLTPKFAVLGGRKVRFYNTVVVTKLVLPESSAGRSTQEVMANG